MANKQNHFVPGLTHGDYPERISTDSSNVNNVIKNIAHSLKPKKSLSPSELDVIVNSIDEAGKTLQSMPDDVLDMSISGLKLRLKGKELDSNLAIQAFAHIREVADRTLGLRHFPSQLKGGWVIYHGMLAQMQTGEGKTLTATLPACAAAMCGIPVHVITSNEYLAQRDAEEMQAVYDRMGLSVRYITSTMDDAERTVAYRADVTYCTNKQITFDYLRDRVVRGNATSPTHLKLHKLYKTDRPEQNLLLRGLCYAIVDEADSVLIDEARTPLILSNTIEGSEHPGTYTKALELAGALQLDVDFILHHKQRSAELTVVGKNKLTSLVKDAPGLWHSSRTREELVQKALVALYLLVRDRQYLIKENKVQIIDDYTGRLMPDRSWERGLHQMVEMKEGCEISGDKETLARITYQRFFRNYLKLGGMTGTTQNIESEVEQTYRLSVVTIPTHKKSKRRSVKPRTFINQNKKYSAVINSVKKFHRVGRPILIGTRSVESSEQLGFLLQQAGLPCKIVNARQDASEAEVIAKAGQLGAITVATNMAGRGTDIKLSEDARRKGGLHVVITERNESYRIDRQLIGRCSRQGDPGSYQVFTSLDDDIPSLFYSKFYRNILSLFALYKGELPKKFGNKLMNQAQRAMEQRHYKARRALEKQEERTAELLSFSGNTE